MRKLLLSLTALLLSAGAFAQGFGSRMADVDLDWDLGESPFSVAPVSYVYFGFNSLINAESDLMAHTGFFRSQQLGANIIELAVKPFEGGRFSFGADFSANWYRLNKDYMWVPYVYAFGKFSGRGENGHFEGLGLFPGGITRLDAPGLKIPHMGWNSLSLSENGRLVRPFSI